MYVFCIRTQSYVTESDQQRTESKTSVETRKTYIFDIKRTNLSLKKEGKLYNKRGPLPPSHYKSVQDKEKNFYCAKVNLFC